MVARQSFRRGSGAVQVRLGRWSEVNMQSIMSVARVLQGWFHYGSGVVQAWFMRGSGAAQVRLGVGGNANCNHRVFRVSFNGG